MLERVIILKENKIFNFEVKQIGLETDRVLRFIGSDESADRDNDIIESAGWKTAEYLKNPVFLWCHDYRIPPIGKCISVKTSNRQLIFDIKFPTISELSSDIENPSDHAKFVDTIYNMYKGGYLSATSVGFRGVKYKTRDDDAVLDKPEWQRGRRYIEQNLMELSAVPVPANPNALQQAKSEGLVDEISIKSFLMPESQKGIQVYGCDDEKAQKLLDLARSYIKEFGIEEKRIVIDGKEKDVFVESVKGDFVSFGFEHLENKEASIRISINLIKALKTKEPELIDIPDSNKEFLALIKNLSEEIEAMKTDYSTRLEELQAKHQEYQDLYSKAINEHPPNNNKGEINLDDIEVPNTENKAASYEPDIKLEELQKLIKEAIDNSVKTAMGKV